MPGDRNAGPNSSHKSFGSDFSSSPEISIEEIRVANHDENRFSEDNVNRNDTLEESVAFSSTESPVVAGESSHSSRFRIVNEGHAKHDEGGAECMAAMLSNGGGIFTSKHDSRASTPGRSLNERLLVVANRLPMTVVPPASPEARYEVQMSAGGLVSGLAGVKGMNFLWIGWPGFEIPVADRSMVKAECRKDNCVPVYLDRSTIELFYNGFCNNVLWPLIHYIPLPMEVGSSDNLAGQWIAYYKANVCFVEAILEVYEDEDIVWVHDYHLMLVPKLLRSIKPKARIGWFLHTPFPSQEVFRMLPYRTELLTGLLSANLVGFHVYDYLRHFISSCVQLLGLESTAQGIDGTPVGGVFVNCGAIPIGIEASQFTIKLKGPECLAAIRNMRNQFGRRKVILGVDRLDYMKGLPHKLNAFDRFLELHPEWNERCVLLQLAVPSRTLVPEYQRLKSTVHELVGMINGRRGNLTYVPVHYLDQSLSIDELVALYRVADVALITSLRDGMNLVAYEFIACQAGKHGVLILSEFAGAAQSLGAGSIRINPWNLDETAEAIHRALIMSKAERRSRHDYAFNHVRVHTSQRWAEIFIESLRDASDKNEEVLACVPPALTVATLVEKFAASTRRLIIVDLLDALTPARGSRGMPMKRFKRLIHLPDEILRALDALGQLPDTYVIITTPHPSATLERIFANMSVCLAAEKGCVYRNKKGNWIRFFEERNPTSASLINSAPSGALSESQRITLTPQPLSHSCSSLPRSRIEPANVQTPRLLHSETLSSLALGSTGLTVWNEWSEGVGKVLEFFQRRTPGSYTERTTGTLTWYWDNTVPDFGKQQSRDLLVHLWAGPLSNASNADVEVVVGARFLEVRSPHCSRVKLMQHILEHEFGTNDPVSSLDFVACIGNFPRRDEDIHQLFEQPVGVNRDGTASWSDYSPGSLSHTNDVKSSNLQESSAHSYQSEPAADDEATPSRLGRPPTTTNISVNLHESISQTATVTSSEHSYAESKDTASDAAASPWPLYYSISVGAGQISKAKFCLPTATHVQNLVMHLSAAVQSPNTDVGAVAIATDSSKESFEHLTRVDLAARNIKCLRSDPALRTYAQPKLSLRQTQKDAILGLDVDSSPDSTAPTQIKQVSISSSVSTIKDSTEPSIVHKEIKPEITSNDLALTSAVADVTVDDSTPRREAPISLSVKQPVMLLPSSNFGILRNSASNSQQQQTRGWSSAGLLEELIKRTDSGSVAGQPSPHHHPIPYRRDAIEGVVPCHPSDRDKRFGFRESVHDYNRFRQPEILKTERTSMEAVKAIPTFPDLTSIGKEAELPTSSSSYANPYEPLAGNPALGSPYGSRPRDLPSRPPSYFQALPASNPERTTPRKAVINGNNPIRSTHSDKITSENYLKRGGIIQQPTTNLATCQILPHIRRTPHHAASAESVLRRKLAPEVSEETLLDSRSQRIANDSSGISVSRNSLCSEEAPLQRTPREPRMSPRTPYPQIFSFAGSVAGVWPTQEQQPLNFSNHGELPPSATGASHRRQQDSGSQVPNWPHNLQGDYAIKKGSILERLQQKPSLSHTAMRDDKGKTWGRKILSNLQHSELRGSDYQPYHNIAPSTSSRIVSRQSPPPQEHSQLTTTQEILQPTQQFPSIQGLVEPTQPQDFSAQQAESIDQQFSSPPAEITKLPTLSQTHYQFQQDQNASRLYASGSQLLPQPFNPELTYHQPEYSSSVAGLQYPSSNFNIVDTPSQQHYISLEKLPTSSSHSQDQFTPRDLQYNCRPLSPLNSRHSISSSVAPQESGLWSEAQSSIPETTIIPSSSGQVHQNHAATTYHTVTATFKGPFESPLLSIKASPLEHSRDGNVPSAALPFPSVGHPTQPLPYPPSPKLGNAHTQ